MTRNNVAYSRHGQGHPLVLLHGFGLDPSIWDTIVDPLAQTYEVIVVGLPGLSNTPFHSFDTMEDMARWLHDILAPLRLGDFVLAGHSMGGYIGLSYLQQYPDNLKGLCLIHSHVYADSEAKKEERKKVAEFVKANGTAAWAKVAVPPLFSANYKRQNPTALKQWITRYSAFEPEVIARYLLAMASRKDQQATLTESALPLGIIMGQHDQHVPLFNNLAQSTLSPVSDIYLLQQSAHMGMIEEPTTMTQAVSGFMQYCFTLPGKTL